MRRYSPTLEEVRKDGLMLYEVIGGSQSHGTNTPDSDVDYRGYYHVPLKFREGLGSVANQVMDKVDGDDIEYYNLKRAFELLMKANPNQIELLWTPEDCIVEYFSPVMDEIIANRQLFITKQSYESHFNYAKNQIRKAKGQNKWVHNPQPKVCPFIFIMFSWAFCAL